MLTSSMRFPSEQRTDFRKLGMNMIPFPELKIITMSQSNFYSRTYNDYS
jgi:hypothetical protein